MEACLETARQPFTALTFPSLATWTETYETEIAGDADFFVVRSRHDKGYYMPCGKADKCLAFMEERARKENPVRFVYVPEAMTKPLEDNGWSILYRGDLSEYIVNTAALAQAEGLFVTHSYRHKVRGFAKTTPYTAREITPADIPLLRQIRDGAAAVTDAAGPSDRAVLEFEIEHFTELGFRGVIIESGEGAAFLFGYEQGPGVFTATMMRWEAGLPKTAGMVCLHELCRILRNDYPRINVEEDLGLGGLRTEKTLLSPVDLLKVYEAMK